MPFLILFIFLLWLAGTIKSVLFWIYLWQLKNYHTGRLIDHFRTHKGKRIIFLYITQFFFWRFKKPVLTAKAVLLIGLAIAVTVIYAVLVRTVIGLVVYNLLVPVIVSAIVLAVQPFFVAARNRILAKARQKMTRFENLTVIGITGSYGKTSTKEFLSTILAEKFKVLATPDHKNSEIGIAQTVLYDLQSSHEIFIVEMGAYNKGGIKLLCDIVKPKIGIVTGVNDQHLATFGSLENLLSAEGGQELLINLPKDGTLLVNGENKYCLDLYRSANVNKKVYAVSREKIDADFWAEEISMQPESLDFITRTKSGEACHVHANVLGKQHVQNILAAMGAAKELGMSLEEIAAAVKNISQKQGGMTLKQGAYGLQVIDSSYSANPDGVAADLDYLAIFPGKKVIVMPCLIELGQKSTQVHEEIGRKIARVADLAIITTKDKFLELHTGIFVEDPKEIFNQITTFCKVGDVVLLEGRVPEALIRLLNGKQI